MKKFPRWVILIIIFFFILIADIVVSSFCQISGIRIIDMQTSMPYKTFLGIIAFLIIWGTMLWAAKRLKPKHPTIARLLVIVVVLQVSASIVIAIAAIAGFLG